jgi:hypothetical protein
VRSAMGKRVDELATYGSEDEETLFLLRDRDHEYTHSEICDLLEKAAELGYSLEKGSELEKLTVRELDRLVNMRQ